MKTFKSNSIQKIVQNGLCTGCGLCSAICPNNAIIIDKYNELYLPKINGAKCTYCGLCLTSCPGYEVDFKELNHIFLRRQPADPLLGNYISCYSGHSNDFNLRFNSSSGGIVTQLLIFALENQLIDGALVVRMKNEKPLEPEVIIAKSKQDIISSSKSKYCPVSIDTGIARILKTSGRFAVVGLPCHIQAIRKAQLIDKRLGEKIVLLIGLVCARTTSFKGTKFFLKTMKIPESSVSCLEYRGKGWPGGMTISLTNGGEFFFPFSEYRTILGSLFFTPQRCFLCIDPLNELADITIGDAWLPQFNNDQEGKSIIISRTENGLNLIKRASQSGQISIAPLSAEKVIESQKSLLLLKKSQMSLFFSVWSFFGKVTPTYGHSNPPQSPIIIKNLSKAVVYYTITTIISRSNRLSNFILFIFGISRPLITRFFSLRYRYSSPYWGSPNKNDK